MRTRISVLAVLFIFFSADFSSAQFKNSKLGAGVLLGGSKLIGDIDNTSTGFTPGVIFAYSPFPVFEISAIATYSNMTSGLNAIKTSVLSGTLSGTFFILPDSKFRPFVSAGVANFHWITTDGNGEKLYRADGTPIAGWVNAWQFSAGLEILAATPWALKTIVSYNLTPSDELDAIIEGKNDGFWGGFVGLVRYFDLGSGSPKSAGNKNWQTANPPKTTESTTSKTDVNATAGGYSDGISFEPNSAELTKKSKEQLQKVYEFLVMNPEEEIQLLGPETGGHSNLIIERARVVQTYLVGLGIEARRIKLFTK